MCTSGMALEWETKDRNDKYLHLLKPTPKHREHSSSPVGLTLWSQDQQHHLGTCLKCRFSESTQTYWMRNSGSGGPDICVLTGPPGESDVCWWLRITALDSIYICSGLALVNQAGPDRKPNPPTSCSANGAFPLLLQVHSYLNRYTLWACVILSPQRPP